MAGSENQQLAGCMCIQVCIREQRTSSSPIERKMFHIYRRGQKLCMYRMEKIRMSLMQKFPSGWI